MKISHEELETPLEVIWENKVSWIANVALTEVGVGGLPFNCDAWSQNRSDKTHGTDAGTGQISQNTPMYTEELRCWNIGSLHWEK